MKNFNTFVEALILTTVKPESDSVAPVKQCGCDNDNFTKVANDYLGGEEQGGGEEVIQPDSDIGETGQEQEESGCKIEEDDGGGLIIRDGETEVRISPAAKDALINYISSPDNEDPNADITADDSEEGSDGVEGFDNEEESEEEEEEQEDEQNEGF